MEFEIAHTNGIAARKSTLQLHRLQKNNPESWGVWPAFEGRVRRFLGKYNTEINEDLFITELQKRWVESPIQAGYWVMIDADDTIVGHICTFIQINFNRPYVLALQVECDQPSLAVTREILRKGMAEMNAWIIECNAISAKNGGLPITYIEHWTIHKPEVVQRMMPEWKHDKVFNVMRVRV